MLTNISLCVPTLNRYDLLNRMIESAVHGTMRPKSINIINNGLKDFQIPLVPNDVDLWIHTPETNMGVSGSWNWFLREVYHPMLIVNDDIEFGPNDIGAFYNGYDDVNHSLHYASSIGGGSVFSCFMLTPDAIDRVGYFDGNIYPAYYEDNDYTRRMMIADCLPYKPIQTTLTHAVSSTIAKYNPEQANQHHRDFQKNRSYYIKKWGGLPGEERYTIPFGDGA